MVAPSRLTVIRIVGKDSGYRKILECRCECGNVKSIRADHFKSGRSKSCGCLMKEVNAELHRSHDMSKTPTYKSWTGMFDRTTNEKHRKYPDYGGRGILVCDRWAKFENFLSDMGVRPPGTSLDRFPDNNGNYEPDNCRWATPRQQANNRRLRKHHKRGPYKKRCLIEEKF